MRGEPSARTCARSAPTRADLPIPASPLTKTTCPSPALLSFQRRRSSPPSSSRPTSVGTVAVTKSSSGPGAARGPRTRLIAMGSATPRRVWVPRSSRANVPDTSRAVTGLITTASGGARPWSRAAILRVSPIAWRSWRPAPPMTPTTTRPVWIPSRTASFTPCSPISRVFRVSHGLDNAQARVHRAPGIVFMSRGVAKIDQQAIAEILGDMARVLLDDCGCGLLVGADHAPGSLPGQAGPRAGWSPPDRRRAR